MRTTAILAALVLLAGCDAYVPGPLPRGPTRSALASRARAQLGIPGTEGWEVNLGVLHYNAEQTQGLLYLAVLPTCATIIRTVNELIPKEAKAESKLTLAQASKDPALWAKILQTPAAGRARDILLAEYAAKGKEPEEAKREVEEYLADPERSMDFLRKCTMAEVVAKQQGRVAAK